MKKLIQLYCNICHCNDNRFREKLQRLSNNNCPKFSDEELITVYLWGKAQQLFQRKAIYNYTKTHLLDWFPDIPSYQAFCRRLNNLTPAMQALAQIWSEQAEIKSKDLGEFVVDSCPIMLATNSRSNRGVIGKEDGICSLCRNATKNQWYHGVKLHVFGRLRPGTLPVPRSMHVSNSTLCDLWAAKQIVLDCKPIENGILYADRAYIDANWSEDLKAECNIDIVTPRKKKKFDVLNSGDCYSTFISGLRQPIESFFNWINEKTNIQNASRIRSVQGLYFHIFSCLALAAYLLNFNY